MGSLKIAWVHHSECKRTNHQTNTFAIVFHTYLVVPTSLVEFGTKSDSREHFFFQETWKMSGNDVIACRVAFLIIRESQKRRRKRRWLMTSLSKSRDQYRGLDFMADLKAEPEYGLFWNFCRLKPIDFEYLLNLVAPQIVRVYESINCNAFWLFHSIVLLKRSSEQDTWNESNALKKPVSEVQNPKLSHIFFYNKLYVFVVICHQKQILVHTNHWRRANILWRSLNLKTSEGTLPNVNEDIPLLIRFRRTVHISPF